jgi:nicotinamide-nucleotide amidase
MRTANILLVGDELLNGTRRDAHLPFLAGALAGAGVAVRGCAVAGDDEASIADIVRAHARTADVVIVCGGLGPTTDDVTREGVARALDRPLALDEEALARLEAFFARTGLTLYPATRRQAYVPSGAETIPNAVGSAPGFLVETGGCRLFVLPGPPRELQAMTNDFVVPRLRRVFNEAPLFTRTFRTAGLGESALAALLEPLYGRFVMFRFASLPARGRVDIVAAAAPGAAIDTSWDELAAALELELRNLLGPALYGTGDVTLEHVVGDLLAGKNMTLAIAESLTGGYMAKQLTDVPGSSRYLLASVVAYADEAKHTFLGVREETLREHGAVSSAVCLEMAEGARLRTGATLALAATGIAGPTGGTPEKPVGLCFFGLSWEGGADIRERVFSGTRADVRERVANASLLMLYEKLIEET